ncbi:MAG: hypothetical protein FWH01_07620 [Oscillospiraceae bacterium]|nr:hypothetical protein [Oscillospiraceae bacterium]
MAETVPTIVTNEVMEYARGTEERGENNVSYAVNVHSAGKKLYPYRVIDFSSVNETMMTNINGTTHAKEQNVTYT